MPTAGTTIATIETLVRRHLLETTASFWTAAELNDITVAGVRDLWRDIVDLKQEHYLVVNTTDVSMPADTSTLRGVPADTHKVYLIEPRDLSSTSSNSNLYFLPLEYNHANFQSARSQADITPEGAVIYYAIMKTGSPFEAPEIRVAPQVNAAVNLTYVYVPTIGPLDAQSLVPIPGEADNALVAWTIAYARAKEREDRSPDPGWIAIYSTEKQHILQSLGVRQLQEPQIVDGLFAELW